MPSIQYQFRVNSDTDPFLFETLDNVPSNERSEYIRQKLLIGIRFDPDMASNPSQTVTQEGIEPVLPLPTEFTTPVNGFSEEQIASAAKAVGTDRLGSGNTDFVLPMPSRSNPAEILRERREKAQDKFSRPNPEVTKK